MRKVSLLSVLLLGLSAMAMAQLKPATYTKVKGETGTYVIKSRGESRYVYKEGTPPVLQDMCLDLKIWPVKRSVDYKAYVKKYLKPEIKGEITRDNSYFSIDYYYNLKTGDMEWITVHHKSSLEIPIEAIERFERIMKRDCKATFNREPTNVPDSITHFPEYSVYNLLDM